MRASSPVRAPYFIAAYCLLGCGGEQLDVGSDPRPGGSDGSSATTEPPPPGEPLPEWPDDSDCELDASAPIDGTWTGYIQGQSPEKGSLTIAFGGMRGDGELCGVVTVGQGAIPPPATGADEVYPPGASYPGHPPRPPLPGVPNRITSGSMDGDRLLLEIETNEIYRSWCQLQTPYYQPTRGIYSCVPGGEGGGMREDGSCYVKNPDLSTTDVACVQVSLCDMYFVCVCNETGCDAGPGRATAPFDLHVEGDSAEGLMDGQAVFLERMP